MNKDNFEKFIYRIYKKWEEYDELEGTDRTWCNYFVTSVLLSCGYLDFNHGNSVLSLSEDYPMMANAICDHLDRDTENWERIEIREDIINQKEVPLIIAALRGQQHGHVAILLPGRWIYSGKWDKEVPICANIGGRNEYGIGINYVFRSEPEYYLFKQEVE